MKDQGQSWGASGVLSGAALGQVLSADGCRVWVVKATAGGHQACLGEQRTVGYCRLTVVGVVGSRPRQEGHQAV